MKKTSFKPAAVVLLAALSACGGGSDNADLGAPAPSSAATLGTAASDGEITQSEVNTLVSQKTESEEPANIDGVNLAKPENAEPIGI